MINLNTSFKLKFAIIIFAGILMSKPAAAQQLYYNNFRTAFGFGYIVDDDNSGAIFSNQYTRELTERINGSVTLEYLSSSRYEKSRQLFTSRKAFIMADVSVIFDVLEKGVTTIKLGVGPAVRRRSELDLTTSPDADDITTPSRANDPAVFVHNRSKDFGGKVTFENDFYSDNRMTFGWRAAGYVYNDGTPIFTAGLHMGFSF